MSTYYNPVETHIGVGMLERVAEILKQRDFIFGKMLLLTRGGDFKSSESYRSLFNQFRDKEVFVQHIEISNPDVADLYRVKQATDPYPYDAILAIGGGTVLDIAKSLAILRNSEITGINELRTIITTGEYKKNDSYCPWIAVPTTSGTGSEVTPWATVWDNEMKLKYSLESRRMFAAVAVVDPDLTLNLPVRTSITTGLDALCHATEAYWSKNTNEISRLYAVQAISYLTENLGCLVDDPHNSGIRSQLAKGSLLAGLAFSNTRTTSCHSISYPLTMMYGIEHGIAVSLTLSQMLRFNEDSIIDKERLLAAFHAESGAGVEKAIASIYSKAGLPRLLREYAVPRDELGLVADRSFTKNRMGNNPKQISKRQLLDLLTSIY
jgi:phosphonate metabolism-associated iron-containing alcohol dehydrogenase